MKFALLNYERVESAPGLVAECQGCGSPVIAKCGQQRIWHWAHQRKCDCDPWWENEGEWHRAWKTEFPEAWQEIPHLAEDGTRHIADIKTDYGWIIELQHSRIDPEERKSRDAFYKQVVWIVDGTRRKSDRAKFERAWNDGSAMRAPIALRSLYIDDNVLLREWAGSAMPVLFDFCDGQWLWWVLPGLWNGRAYVVQFPRAQFIHILKTGNPAQGLTLSQLLAELTGSIDAYERNRRLYGRG